MACTHLPYLTAKVTRCPHSLLAYLSHLGQDCHSVGLGQAVQVVADRARSALSAVVLPLPLMLSRVPSHGFLPLLYYTALSTPSRALLLALEALAARLIEPFAGQFVGEVLLRDGVALVVVGVLVALAVAQVFHQAGGGVAQV